MFDADLTRRAKENAEKPFKEGEKTFSVTLKVSPSDKPQVVREKFRYEVLRVFNTVHDKACYAVNSKVSLTLYTPDTMFDFNKFSAHTYEIKKALDAIGLKRAGLIERHIKSVVARIDVEVSFKDVSPLDIYRTKGIE